MKLKVIVDNNTNIDQYYLGEPAVSYLIEDEDSLFLFDVGYSDIFLKNLTSFGVDQKRIKTVVLSHGHDDHTRGLTYLLEEEGFRDLNIIAHPEAFYPKFDMDHPIGSPFTREQLQKRCALTLSRGPVKVSKNITFLGEIPEHHNFEKNRPVGTRLTDRGESQEDFLIDDSALVYHGREGLYIITGCSHRGICNIIEQARLVCGCDTIKGILGGFHLFEEDERTEKTISYLKNLHLDHIYPCHCTSFAVKASIHREIPVREVGVGMELIWQ